MISQKRYVRITSGVGAGQGVRGRNLTMRLITEDSRISASEIMKFTSPESVAKVFSTESEIYRRAVKYFGFLSKAITSPTEMSVVRWVNQAVPPSIKGANPAPLATLKTISAGSLRFYIDGAPSETISGISLTTATSENVVATTLTGKTAALTAPVLKNSTFTWNASQGVFVWTGTQNTAVKVEIKAVTTDALELPNLLGFTSENAVVSPGQVQETLEQCAARTSNEDNDFGSLIVCRSANPAFADLLSLAKWNKTQNNMYMLLIGVSMADIDSTTQGQEFSNYKGIAGLGITLNGPRDTDYTDQFPAEILASIDYDAVNGTQNFMFYDAADRAYSVKDDPTADKLDALRVNYIGVTQTAGQKIAFYQRGLLQGGATDPADMNVYANEIWMKDYIAAGFLSMFLNLQTVPADEEGRNSCISVLQDAADKGKSNGVITVGKPLNNTKKLYIKQITGDPMAWHQIATIGYWYNVTIEEKTTTDGRTEYYAKYTFLYSKGDAIRAVEGRDILI